MQRFDTIGALGNPLIKTPALDRLTREGTSFVSAYSPSPVCVPARCSLHYGQYPARTGLAENGPWPAGLSASVSMPDALARNGYHTASIGKCHFEPNHKAMNGFHERLTQEEARSNPEDDDYCRWLKECGGDYDEPHGMRSEMYYVPQISQHPQERHPTNWIGDRTIDYIQKHKNSDQPWFLFSSFIHPHPPFALPKPWHKLYRSPLMPDCKMPEDYKSLLCYVNHYQNRYKYRDKGFDRQFLRLMKAYYYACVSFVDFQIGRIVQTLEESGELDNTLIMFTSDHGEYLGDYGCFGKRGMHDSSARIPMIARYPKAFAAGNICKAPVSLVDLYPTSLEAAGIEKVNSPLDGESLIGVARGQSERKYVFSEFRNGNSSAYTLFAAISETHKYIWSTADRREWLFDRVTDPQETRNYAGLYLQKAPLSELRNAAFSFLQSHNRKDVIEETADGKMHWRVYPSDGWIESWRDNPEAHLLMQDHSLTPTVIPGYMGQDDYRTIR